MAGVVRAFFAYPSQNGELRSTIEDSAKRLNSRRVKVDLWPNMDVFGASIPDEIRESIKRSKFVFCDVTIPNENVYYELGFSMGLGKRVGPVVNSGFAGATERIRREGIFDNIGYKSYENSGGLRGILEARPRNIISQVFRRDINYDQPIYFLDSKVKTDFRNSITSALKRAKGYYRSFDPLETPRLSAFHTIAEVSSSLGVVIPFLNDHIDDHEAHNLRAAFIAGLAHGLGRPTLLMRLQGGRVTEPTDFRDNIVKASDTGHIEETVRDFVQAALTSAQDIERDEKAGATSALRAISLGAVAAENEFRTLEQYFVETSEFSRTVRGEVKVVTGRKGSGKSAIFFRARDTLRKRRRTVVVDLKPESHQLLEFRETLAKTVEAGVIDHSLAAFWHYIILSEILLKLRDVRKLIAENDAKEAEYSLKVENAIGIVALGEIGDFTSRLKSLSQYFLDELVDVDVSQYATKLDEITNTIYAKAIPPIRALILEGTLIDDDIVVLFDNIDKGWPSTGVEPLDTRVVRLLLEAFVKIGQDLSAKNRNLQSTVFIRNDIFEILVSETPDRGKAGRINIDWTDPEKLRQVILRRLQASLGGADLSFDDIWKGRFVDRVDGVDSFEFFVRHSLMRPRFLIGVIEYAIANAINRGHSSVMEQDCKDAVKQHGYSLLDDFGYEIRDVSKIPADVMYSLVGSESILSSTEIIQKLTKGGLSPPKAEEAFKLLLWYGAIGVHHSARGEVYIYDVDYNIKRLEAEMRRDDYEDKFVINPALHVALE